MTKICPDVVRQASGPLYNRAIALVSHAAEKAVGRAFRGTLALPHRWFYRPQHNLSDMQGVRYNNQREGIMAGAKRGQTEGTQRTGTAQPDKYLCLVEVQGNLRVVLSPLLREEAARAAGRVPLPNLEKDNQAEQ